MDARSGRFVGRRDQLSLLERDLDDVRRTGRGRFVLLRGRRRVGKSRLVSEFLRNTGVPAVFYAARWPRSATSSGSTPPMRSTRCSSVPGADADTVLVAVSRNAVDATGLDTVLGPDDIVDAWR